MINILICDDQTVVREGLAAIIGSDPGIGCLQTARSGSEALELAKKSMPDIVLMDLNMPEMNGIQVTRELKKLYPSLPVLILTTFAHDEWIFDALKAGAAGYLLKDTRKEELLKAIKGTVSGLTFLDPSIAGRLLRQLPHLDNSGKGNIDNDFTEKELAILGYIVQGYSNPQIGEKLFLAPGTVRNYASVIFGKLGVSDRTQAAIKAVQTGLIDFE